MKYENKTHEVQHSPVLTGFEVEGGMHKPKGRPSHRKVTVEVCKTNVKSLTSSAKT